MAYTKIGKPKAVDFLEREEGSYLLLENGGRIIIRSRFDLDPKPDPAILLLAENGDTLLTEDGNGIGIGSYIKVPKPAIT